MKDLIVKFILSLLPKRHKETIQLGLELLEMVDTEEERQQFFALARQLYYAMDTVAERRAAFKFFLLMFKDGKVTVGEWAQFGSIAGFLGKLDER